LFWFARLLSPDAELTGDVDWHQNQVTPVRARYQSLPYHVLPLPLEVEASASSCFTSRDNDRIFMNSSSNTLSNNIVCSPVNSKCVSLLTLVWSTIDSMWCYLVIVSKVIQIVFGLQHLACVKSERAVSLTLQVSIVVCWTMVISLFSLWSWSLATAQFHQLTFFSFHLTEMWSTVSHQLVVCGSWWWLSVYNSSNHPNIDLQWDLWMWDQCAQASHWQLIDHKLRCKLQFCGHSRACKWLLHRHVTVGKF
jgi:hypothetical protein